MTRGSKSVHPDASIYDLQPIMLFDRFRWSEYAEREAVLAALESVLSAGSPKWTFGGAYLFWCQSDTGGALLYCGEAVDLLQRQAQHFRGGPDQGNKFVDLSAHFVVNPDERCGLALLVIPPKALPWQSPPGGPLVLLDGAAKEAGQGLEGFLLRASVAMFGRMPEFNGRNDAALYRNDTDTVRFESLLRYLLEDPEASQDFTTFLIRDEAAESAAHLRARVTDCEGLQYSGAA